MALELVLDIYSVPSIIALFINFIILILVFRIRPVKIQNIFFMLMLLGFMIWTGCQIAVRSATDVSTVMFWGRLEHLGGHFASLFFLCFVLAFSGVYNKKNSKYLFSIIIPYMIVITYLMFWTDLFAPTFKHYVWGYSPQPGPLFFIIAFFHSLFSIAGLVLLYLTYKREDIFIIKTQAKLILVGSSIPVLIGGITDVILPSLGITVFELAGILTVIMAGFIAYAITKYRFMFSRLELIAKVVFDSMNDCVIVIDTTGNITNVNKATLNLLGYQDFELIGKPINKLIQPGKGSKKTNPGTDMKFKNVELQRLMNGSNIKDVEMIYKTKDSRRIPMSFSGSFMKDKTGGIEGIVCVAKDLRETKMHQDLQHAYQELRSIQAKLLQKEKLAGIGSLATRVAHEINNPLQVIIGTTEIILDENDPGQIQKDGKDILIAADRIKEIVRDLSIYSRDASTIKVQPWDINRIIKQSCELVKFSSKLTNIKFRFYLQKLSKIKVNKEEMQQVFINLITNGIDAMDENGKLSIGSFEHDNLIQVQITDTGKGISEVDQKKIFDPFFTTKEVGKGTGLGLFVVHQIVKRYHGIIDVNSQPGKGTTITLKLPVSVNI